MVCGGGFIAFFCFFRSVAGATEGVSEGTRDNIPFARARRSQSSRRRGVLGGREEATVVDFEIIVGKKTIKKPWWMKSEG